MNSERHTESDSAIQALISHWDAYKPGASGPYIHEADDAFISKRRRSTISECSVEAYLKQRNIRRVHTALHPVPYMGNLEKADLFLLMINPSLTYKDYGTHASESFQTELSAEIRQKRERCLALDPEFWWTSWFTYYRKLFGPVLQEFGKFSKQNRYQALTSVASRLAILELVPYSSVKAETVEDISFRLPSSNLARAAAQEIAERARQRTATVIVRWIKEEGKKETRWRFGPVNSYGNYLVPSVTRSGFSKEAQAAVLKRLKKPYNKSSD